MVTSTQVNHPAPERYNLSPWRVWMGFVGAPVAWVAQMSLGYMVSSAACYSRRAPLAVSQFDWLMPALAIICIVCIAAAFMSAYVAWRGWKQLHNLHGKDEKYVIERGEERARFLGMLGLFSSSIFTFATLLTACVLLFAWPCSVGV